jgi:flavin-dependent dehydrogenase
MGNGRQFDVVIIGGGAAGSAAALTLMRQRGRAVAIVEKSDPAQPHAGETIPPDANLLLAELGVTEAFRAQDHLPCYGSHSLWGSAQLGHNDFVVNAHGHGWHLNRARFDAMLLDQAERAGATVFRHTICHQVVCEKDRVDNVSIKAATGEQVELAAQAFIDATGRKGVLVKALGVAKDYDDRQVVIWARFRLADTSGFGNSTWLESTTFGWWYGARLPGREAVVALGTDPPVAKSMGVYEPKSWLFQLAGTRLMAPRLEGARLIPDTFRITSSQSYCIRRAAGENWFAVGDAASAFDPLSSAGIYKALLTGQLAARAISGVEPATQRRTYQTRINDDYHTYLDMRAQLYQAEQRWTDHDFWNARSALSGHDHS